MLVATHVFLQVLVKASDRNAKKPTNVTCICSKLWKTQRNNSLFHFKGPIKVSTFHDACAESPQFWTSSLKYYMARAREAKRLTFWPFSRLSNGQNAVKTLKATLLSRSGSQQLTRQLLPTASGPIKHLAERFCSFLSPRISLWAQFPNQQWLFYAVHTAARAAQISRGDDVQADGLRERSERLRAWTACGSYNEISRDEQRGSSKTQLGSALRCLQDWTV